MYLLMINSSGSRGSDRGSLIMMKKEEGKGWVDCKRKFCLQNQRVDSDQRIVIRNCRLAVKPCDRQKRNVKQSNQALGKRFVDFMLYEL